MPFCRLAEGHSIVTRTGISHGLKNLPPAGSLPVRGLSVFRIPLCSRRCDPYGNLPRPKKVSTGHFFTLPSVGPAFRFPYGYKKKNHSIWSGAARLVIDIRPQSLRIVDECQWNLPRTKKPATGRFFASLRSVDFLGCVLFLR